MLVTSRPIKLLQTIDTLANSSTSQVLRSKLILVWWLLNASSLSPSYNVWILWNELAWVVLSILNSTYERRSLVCLHTQAVWTIPWRPIELRKIVSTALTVLELIHLLFGWSSGHLVLSNEALLEFLNLLFILYFFSFDLWNEIILT